MPPGDTTPGRRVPASTPVHELELGDYMLQGAILWGHAPNGEIARVDERWSIEEHDDGTISVGPKQPGEAYSIWINKPDGWHGYLERGVWREV